MTDMEKVLQNEADTAGLDIFGSNQRASYRDYKFKACGHIQGIKIENVRTGKFKCVQCSEISLMKLAEENNLEFIGIKIKLNSNLYRFKSCGHEQVIASNNIINKNITCDMCFNLKLCEEARRANLELVEIIQKSRPYIYRCLKCSSIIKIKPGDVKSKNFNCSTCAQNELMDKAKLGGLSFLNKDKVRRYHNIYEFKSCGHKQSIRNDKVKSGVFSCNTCEINKLKNEAKIVGLEYIDNCPKAGSKIYKFIDCGHQQEIRISRVRENVFKCNECHQSKLKAEASNSNLTLIGQGKNAHYRIYSFNGCGHQQEIRVDKVRGSNVRCQVCQTDKVDKEAFKVGLKVISNGKTPHYRLYEFIQCGHQQEIKVGHVRDNLFLCNMCEESAWTQESGVYIFEIIKGDYAWLKIGVAKNTKNRISQYGLCEDSTVNEIAYHKISSGREARELEKEIHKLMSKYSLPSNKMKKFMPLGGFSECFDIKGKSLALSKIESIQSKNE
ncbi:GIY-YIG nuclease family protein [Pseudoalteromonas tetraodonis]|nr:GIY-YIG nuclease family protein [Pseudoalteromonas tetraodonis]